MKVNLLAVARRILHARADTAPPGIVRLGKDFGSYRCQAEEVTKLPRLSANVGEDVVDEHTLDKIHLVSLRLPLKHHAGELDHVVGVTSL